MIARDTLPLPDDTEINLRPPLSSGGASNRSRLSDARHGRGNVEVLRQRVVYEHVQYRIAELPPPVAEVVRMLLNGGLICVDRCHVWRRRPGRRSGCQRR